MGLGVSPSGWPSRTRPPRCALPPSPASSHGRVPSLGRLDFFQTQLTHLAGYGIQAFLIVQDLSQLCAASGGHACGTRATTWFSKLPFPVAAGTSPHSTSETSNQLISCPCSSSHLKNSFEQSGFSNEPSPSTSWSVSTAVVEKLAALMTGGCHGFATARSSKSAPQPMDGHVGSGTLVRVPGPPESRCQPAGRPNPRLPEVSGSGGSRRFGSQPGG